jgi:hypothetical protein
VSEEAAGKVLICLYGSSNTGKSATLREFGRCLCAKYPSSLPPVYPAPPDASPVPDKGDFTLVLNINGKIIGIESPGDPKTDLKKRLKKLADSYNCSLIICSARTRGETVRAVNNTAKNNGFKIIRTSTYQIAGKASQETVNKLRAKQILELINELRLI